MGPYWDQTRRNSQSLRHKLHHPGRICGDPLAVMLIDHARAGMAHLANDPFLRDAGGELLADECVSYSVRPTTAYLGFFQMSTPKVISYRTAPSDWCGLFVWLPVIHMSQAAIFLAPTYESIKIERLRVW